MIRLATAGLILAVILPSMEAIAGTATAQPQGFGASARGGSGGRTIEVTRLDDDADHPQPGTLRWALRQTGPRIIRFRVAGTIQLQDRVIVREPRVTIDGEDAPALGVCIAGGSLEFRDTHDVIIRHVRIRLGDAAALRTNRSLVQWRPENSRGLDCLNLLNCDRVLIDHCSLSWSCDEIVSVVRCRDVTVQWCILSEPLSNRRLHPYGNHHAACINASASTLSVHHCLFAHYIFRGPQFEANDMRRGDHWPVRMEAWNNLMFDYKHSAIRYTAGVEERPEESKSRRFDFVFGGNEFIPAKQNLPSIEVITRHGVHPGVHASLIWNWGADPWSCMHDPARQVTSDRGKPLDAPLAAQVSNRIPFIAPIPVQGGGPKPSTWDRFLDTVGCSTKRDAADDRILADVKSRRMRPVLHTQDAVGAWPPLDGRPRPPRHLARQLFFKR